MADFTRRTFLIGSCLLIPACKGEGSGSVVPPPAPPTPPPPGTLTFPFSFANGFAGWEADYADYTLGQEATIGFAFGFERLPPDLADRSGIFLQSDNRSDDVFMYISRQVDGLAPNRRYRVDLDVTFATNAPPGCAGIGGSPGEAVKIKAGATALRPEKVVGPNNYVAPNFDKGLGNNGGGANAAQIGDFAQAQPGGNCMTAPYQRKTLGTGGDGVTVTSDSSGRLWLLIGTDSGHEGRTRIYYLEMTATLTPV